MKTDKYIIVFFLILTSFVLIKKSAEVQEIKKENVLLREKVKNMEGASVVEDSLVVKRKVKKLSKL